MKKQVKKVQEFHEAFKAPVEENLVNIAADRFRLRHRLMEEENNEYLQACEENDLQGIADAVADKLYILCGTIVEHGLQDYIEPLFNEVHRSNMSKLDADGNPIIREDGKILKSERYFKPNLKKVINRINKKKSHVSRG